MLQVTVPNLLTVFFVLCVGSLTSCSGGGQTSNDSSTMIDASGEASSPSCDSACSALECGTSNGCDCGMCEQGKQCIDNVCTMSETCKLVCAEVQCGDHYGCGCGDCPGGQLCSKEGACAPDPCTVDCAERECGTVGDCDCGACAIGACTEEGICELKTECDVTCSGRECGKLADCDCGTCSEPDVCLDGGICFCVPNCSERDCDDDGCGGSCGQCTEGAQCKDGLCHESSCVPDCTGIECGDDGCKGDCGTCDDLDPCTTDWCEDGACNSESNPCCLDSDCADLMTCTQDICDDALGCIHMWLSNCCGNGLVETGEECDDLDIQAGDGCSPECTVEPYMQFLGFVDWYQNCHIQSDAQQDQAMDTACQNEFGQSSRAAETLEYFGGTIVGFPPVNYSGGSIYFKCPGCEGVKDLTCIDGHARNCTYGGELGETPDDFIHSCDEGGIVGAVCVVHLLDI